MSPSLDVPLLSPRSKPNNNFAAKTMSPKLDMPFSAPRSQANTKKRIRLKPNAFVTNGGTSYSPIVQVAIISACTLLYIFAGLSAKPARRRLLPKIVESRTTISYTPEGTDDSIPRQYELIGKFIQEKTGGRLLGKTCQRLLGADRHYFYSKCAKKEGQLLSCTQNYDKQNVQYYEIHDVVTVRKDGLRIEKTWTQSWWVNIGSAIAGERKGGNPIRLKSKSGYINKKVATDLLTQLQKTVEPEKLVHAITTPTGELLHDGFKFLCMVKQKYDGVVVNKKWDYLFYKRGIDSSTVKLCMPVKGNKMWFKKGDLAADIITYHDKSLVVKNTIEVGSDSIKTTNKSLTLPFGWTSTVFDGKTCYENKQKDKIQWKPPKTDHFKSYWVGLKSKNTDKAIYLRDDDQQATEKRAKQFEKKLREVLPLFKEGAFKEGASVTIHGLKSKPQMNGQKGTLGKPHTEQNGRWVVILEDPSVNGGDEKVSVKPINLKPTFMEPANDAPARGSASKATLSPKERQFYLNSREFNRTLKAYLEDHTQFPETADELRGYAHSSEDRKLVMTHIPRLRTRRRNAQREFSSHCDSPVILRLLEEIGRAQQKSD